MAKKKSDIDTQKVEEEAVMVVKHQLNKSPYLSTIDIPMNDKTPSWDGNVFLYKTPDDKTKKNIDCRIPAQVKGKVIRNYESYCYMPEKTILPDYITIEELKML